MRRELKRLADERFDVAIIGGGVYGLCTAWACALRGLTVGLIERGDFGAATSSGSLKLVHGGLRYLQHLDFPRMRLSIQERRNFLRMAPHLVHPLPFLIPCYGHALKGPEAMRLALSLNDLIAWDRNRGIPDPARHIPRSRMVTAQECLRVLPGLDKKTLTGAAIFYDGQMYSSERLSLAFALSAAQAGAALANYAEAVRFVVRGPRIVAVAVRDVLSGSEFELRAEVFINMTGPWADITVARLHGPEPSRTVRRSKGIQLIVRPKLGDMAFGVESRRERDKTARIRRGNRSYFATPWRNVTIIGTTDTLFVGDPDSFGVTEMDIEEFLAAFNEAYPGAGLKRSDVLFWCGGLRPLGDVDADPDHVQAAHHPEIVDHALQDGPENLLTVVGVKYTVVRALAERTADWIVRRLGRGDRESKTGQARVLGGEFDDMDSLVHETETEMNISRDVAAHLVRMYGTQVRALFALARARPELRAPLPGHPEVLRVQVVHACQAEAAQRLADIVFRRTELGATGDPGAEALEECAALAARELEWEPGRVRSELREVRATFTPAAR